MRGFRPRRQPVLWEQALQLGIGPTVADPDFAVPNVGTGMSAYQYGPAGAPWAYQAMSPGPPPAGSGVAGNGSAFTQLGPNSIWGTQCGFIQTTGSISQSIVFPAGSYKVYMQALQRYHFNTVHQDFQVQIDGVPHGSITPTGTTWAEYFSSSFTVTAGAHTVALVGTNTPGGDNTAFVSQIQILPY